MEKEEMSVPTRDELIDGLIAIISDYREGEIRPINSHDVDLWVRQFPETARDPILAELAHVFGRTYFSRERVGSFLATVVASQDLTSGDPCAFWSSASLLDIQRRGMSQKRMLAQLQDLIVTAYGAPADVNGQSATYVYVDDGVFGGGHVTADLGNWLETDAPPSGTVHVVCIALHTFGQFDAAKKLSAKAAALGKVINFQWWKGILLENRRSSLNRADVLRPRAIPADEEVQAFVARSNPPVLRTSDGLGALGLYSSESARNTLEQEFLKAGVTIRSQNQHLNMHQRPLGNSTFPGLGFGTLFLTYQNIPNNCPLALWAGNYPLFHRRPN